MIIYPAIDLMGGACVRLAQGRFDEATTYPADPVDAVRAFEAEGAEWVHIVDLDGARAGAPRQHGLLADIALSATLKLQVAGGFREPAHLKRMFDAGVDRVVIGSLAVAEPEQVRALIAQFGGDRITIALDVNLVEGVPMVATRGWTRASTLSLWDAAARFPEARHLLVTDISRDGMMTGPNLELVTQAVRTLPNFAIQASGGVGHMRDVGEVASTRAAALIVGKALWEGRFTLREAIDAGA